METTLESNSKYLSDEFLDWETRHESVPFWKHVIAGKKHPCCKLLGSCAGMAEHCSMFPIDTIKVNSVVISYSLLDARSS
jgi:hypothetical protein